MVLNYQQLMDYIIGAGGTQSQAQVGAAIEEAESGGDTAAVGDQGNSYGTWQIYLPAHPEVSKECAQDESCATMAAKVISNDFTNWSPWTTYTSGKYQQFLQGGTAGGVSTLSAPGAAGAGLAAGTSVGDWLGKQLGGITGPQASDVFWRGGLIVVGVLLVILGIVLFFKPGVQAVGGAAVAATPQGRVIGATSIGRPIYAPGQAPR